jgi:multidrug efflux pump subunit AcrB
MQRIPGIADVAIQQSLAEPTLLISAHRAFALGAGLTESNIADNTLATLSGSGQTAPTYWLDSKTGVSHLVNLQTPQDQLTSVNDLETIPIDQGDGDPTGRGTQLLGGLSDITQTGRPLEVSHRDIMPVIDIYANTQGLDLGSVSTSVDKVLKKMKSGVPHGASVSVQGQSVTVKEAYSQLLIGLAFSIVLVYLVIVVNFQSWLDPSSSSPPCQGHLRASFGRSS